MPNVSITVPELQQSVARPVIHDIVRQICELTHLPKNIPIYIPGDTENVAQKGSTTGEQSEGGTNTRLTSDSNIQIEVEESFNEGNILSTAVSQTEQLPIFMDTKLGVLIRPAYSSNDVRLTFKFTSNSRTVADRWRSDIRMRISMMRDLNLHMLQYSYPVPKKFYDVLEAIWKLREAQAPYGQSFDEYVQAHCSTRITRASTPNGTFSGLVVAETQTRVQGMFDFEYAPERAVRDGNSENWVSTFTYNFRYDKPIFCNMKYPVMVHNQLLDMQWIPQKSSPNFDQKRLSFSLSLGDFHKTEATAGLDRVLAKQPLIRIPEHDEFIAFDHPTDTQRFMEVLCQIDPSDPTLLLNLKDLDSYQFDQDVLELIKSQEWKFMYKPYQSILLASVFCESLLISHEAVFIDAEFNLRTTVPMDLRRSYRVRFSLHTNLGQLPTEALKRLKHNPKAGTKLLRSLGVRERDLLLVRQRCDLFPLFPEWKLDQRTWMRYHGTLTGMKTVNSMFVVARKQK